MSNVIVIGAGAGGMMAAVAAAENGHAVTVLEKNEKCGKKIYITGKGRCNFTNTCDTDSMMQQILRNPKFLYTAFADFSNEDTIAFFRDHGMPVKVERGGRAFPVSDHASDVTKVLTEVMREKGVRLKLNTEVTEVLIRDGAVYGVRARETGKKQDPETVLHCDALIIATGGLSYPSTGSTGDGYRFAEEAGHRVTDRRPSLVGIDSAGTVAQELEGLSLRNISIRVLRGKKCLYEEFGEMLFTRTGLSGPVILSASAKAGDAIAEGDTVLEIDLKPALTEEKLRERLDGDLLLYQQKAYKNALSDLLPRKLIPVFIQMSGIDPEQKAGTLSGKDRQAIVSLLKHFRLQLTGLRGYSEAVVTKGGVSVKEVDPHTMESKLVKGLYFAGEVLDLDGYTGGFNLQIAWSTGHLAGSRIP